MLMFLQEIIEAMRIHYNFCREYQTLGMTPSETTGIKLDLQENRIENLIRLSALENKGKK